MLDASKNSVALETYGSVPTDADRYWPTGSIAKYSSPSTYIGAVCTTSGAPGTWKNYGAITA